MGVGEYGPAPVWVTSCACVACSASVGVSLQVCVCAAARSVMRIFYLPQPPTYPPPPPATSHPFPTLTHSQGLSNSNNNKANKQAAAAPLLQRVLSCFAVLIICGRRERRKAIEQESGRAWKGKRRAEQRRGEETITSSSLPWHTNINIDTVRALG